MGMPPPPPPNPDGAPSNQPGWSAQPPPPPPGLPGAPVGTMPNYPPAYYEQVGPGGERAGFGIRLGAWLLDGLLYGLLSAVFVVPALLVGASAFRDCDWVEMRDNEWELLCPPGEPDGGPIAAAIAIAILGWLFVAFLYVRAMGRTGQTWGARIVGVKVVDERTGSTIGFGRALGRSLFANIISANVLYLGYLWMLWDDRKQTWQDKVVNSVVVRT